MSSPLAPMTDTALNLSTPATAKRYENYEVRAYTTTSDDVDEDMNGSSPLAPNYRGMGAGDQENISPSKSRHSRVLSGAELSPLKLLAEPLETSRKHTLDGASVPMARSPRKMSPEKRFPVKVSNPMETPRPTKTAERTIDLDHAVQQNEGLKKAIEIFEDEQSFLDNDEANVSTGTVHITASPAHDDEEAGPDDTMISTFSTFSAVPNMSMLTKVGQGRASLAPASGPSPSSRNVRPGSRQDHGNTMNLLMDFTEQLRHPQKSPSKRGNLSPSRTTPNVAATPSRQYTNLIDFDIPPMPTPRSVPTITPRELESLKSNFLSEISSLKASLSGKEAEVQSLKTAVGDAEMRVGESMEQLREERATREQLAAEKEDWEKRGCEMETVLRKIKEEIVLSHKEREQLEQKLEESEKRREAAEMMHQEAESKMAGMRAGKESDKSSPDKPSNREVEIAVERVARELHGLYKSKHETKVAALKKSYEARWEKKIRELEGRIEELGEDNERLRIGRDATMTKVDPGSAEAEERKVQAVRDSAAIKELNADIQRLEAVVSTVQRDNEDLRGMLEKERIEKGELVQLAEEMMNMQSFVSPAQQQPQRQPQQRQPPQQQQQERTQATPRAAPTPRPLSEGVKSSGIGRPGSGLRAPQSGLRAPHERTKSGGGGLPRPGGVSRSGIMSSIEKMGNYRGRTAE
ncbi:hypothetical protein HJFPF1_03823 [Paramyrothecium foliicola]|nr:hypothetical protein HJFPF1_03823 [Paramyrothecium foliicola]